MDIKNINYVRRSIYIKKNLERNVAYRDNTSEYFFKFYKIHK